MMYGFKEDDDLGTALIGLASGGPSRDWIRRHKLPGKGPNYGEYVMLEQDSSELFTYHTDLIPGLLQTPEYARAVMASVPSSGGPEDAVEIRDSTDPSGPRLTLTPETWRALLVQLKGGG